MRILNQEENRDYSLIENLVKENYEVAESFISVADDDSEINEHLPTEQ